MAAVAPSATHCRHFSSLPAVTTHGLPASRQRRIAAVPTPPPPPCTSAASPGASAPRPGMTRFETAVRTTAGQDAFPTCTTDSSPGSRITIARIGDGSPQASRPSQSGRARLDLVRGATYASRQPMLVLVLLVAALVAVALWRLAARVRDVDRQVKELRLLRREIEELGAEVDRGLGVTRAHLAAVAAGEPPERDVILRGAPWRDIQPAEALAPWGKTPGLFVLDVRTPAEFATGHIPNAHLIPVDELEDRLGELPPRDTPMLVHCAAGGRSAAACQPLGQRGYTRLRN